MPSMSSYVDGGISENRDEEKKNCKAELINRIRFTNNK